MAEETKADALGELSLDDVLAQYIACEETGSAPDRQELLKQHPQFADDLREFFANRDQMQRLAQPLRGDAEVPRGCHPLGKLRYFGDYELMEEVAAGGMGIVYKARQVSLNRIVAVKMILKGTLAREEDVKRFQSEAEAAASLQHPAIVAIHEIGLHEGQHYFSMDYVDGHSLAELPREQPLSARQAAEYVRDAAEAVHYAHQQGTLHRDLKPSNILIDRQNRVRITDFGLAKRIEGNSDLTLTGQILGTPSYMPPEQASGKRSLVAAASDIYSLGAVLYELLAGRPPFRGESPAETLRQVESLDPISPRFLSPTVPRDLETICLKCLEKEPHKRYGTAQLLADDLGHYLRGEPIVARPISRVARAWRWCNRHPVTATLSASLMLSLIAGALISSYFAWRANRWAHDAALQAASANSSAITATRESRRANQQAEEAGRLAHREAAAHAEAERLNRKYVEAIGDLDLAKLRLDETNTTLKTRQQDLHRTTIQLAQAAIHGHRPDEALRHLTLLPVEAKTWESRFCESVARPLVWEQDGGACAAFSTDGKWVAIGSHHGWIEISNMATGRMVHRLVKVHPLEMAFGPDDAALVFAELDQVQLWNFLDGQCHTLGAGSSFAFDNARKRLTIVDKTAGRLHFWDVRGDLQVVPDDSRSLPGALQVAPGGRLILAFNDDKLQLHDLTTGDTRECRAEKPAKARSVGKWEQFSFGDEGHLIAAGRAQTFLDGQWRQNVRGQVVIWETETALVRQTLEIDNAKLDRICFIPSTRLLVVGSTSQSTIRNTQAFQPESRVSLWNVEPTQLMRALPRNASPVRSLAISPNTRWLAASDSQKLTIWDISSPTQGTILGRHQNRVHSVAISPDSRWVAACSATKTDDVVCVWDCETGTEAFRLAESHQCDRLEFSKNGVYLASAGRRSALWEFASRKRLLDLGDSSCVSFSPDGTRLAIVRSQTAEIWDIGSSKQVATFPTGGYGVAFSPDGTRLVTGGRKDGVVMWDVMTQRKLWSFEDGATYRVAFSPDGHSIAVGQGAGKVQLLDANTGRMQRFWLTSWTSDYVVDLRFSPDGEVLATANYSEVGLWNPHTGEKLQSLTHPEVTAPVVRDRPYAVAFSPDGARLISGWGHIHGKRDIGAIVVWDTATGSQSPAFRWLCRPEGLFPPFPQTPIPMPVKQIP